ncbi:MAG: hypothetical protein Q9166_000746 [cf. Caloplaca sp. 2 TL-2023]
MDTNRPDSHGNERNPATAYALNIDPALRTSSPGTTVTSLLPFVPAGFCQERPEDWVTSEGVDPVAAVINLLSSGVRVL